MNEQGDGRTGTFSKWITRARQYQEKLERRPWMAFPLESVRRFNKIDGKHLALVIAIDLFVAVIPLIIISYALIEAFNPHRDVGNLIAGNLQLTGSTAQIVKNTFTNASSGKSVALGISVISLLVTGLDVSATAQTAYARAFTMTPLRGIQKYLRGGAWLVLLLSGSAGTALPPSRWPAGGGNLRIGSPRVLVAAWLVGASVRRCLGRRPPAVYRPQPGVTFTPVGWRPRRSLADRLRLPSGRGTAEMHAMTGWRITPARRGGRHVRIRRHIRAGGNVSR